MTYNVFGGTLNPTLLLLLREFSRKITPCFLISKLYSQARDCSKVLGVDETVYHTWSQWSVVLMVHLISK